MSVALEWFLVLTVVVAALIVLALMVGMALPEAHTASLSARIPGAPPEVWSAIADPAGYPVWRPDVEEVEVLDADEEGAVRWVERSRAGTITLEAVERSPPDRLEMRIADDDLPFGGTWRVELEPEDGGATRVTVTENGVIHHPIFRFAARFVLGYDARMRDYLDGLRNRPGTGGPAPGRCAGPAAPAS